MTRNHLRQQRGGNPAQGPVPEMANPSPDAADGGDFPDAPSDDSAPVQDQPDLDDFAERLGLSTEADSPEPDADFDTRSSVTGRAVSWTKGAARTLASGLDRVSRGLAGLADRLRPDESSDRD